MPWTRLPPAFSVWAAPLCHLIPADNRELRLSNSIHLDKIMLSAEKGFQGRRAVFFLVPERLACYFQVIGLLYFAVILFSWEKPSVNYDGFLSIIFDDLLAAIFPMVLMTIIVPFTIYVLCRRSVLRVDPDDVPLSQWPYLAFGATVRCRSILALMLKFAWQMMRITPDRTQPMYWAPLDERQRAFAKRAIIGLLVSSSEETNSKFWHRLAFYWAAPVWSSYLVLLFLLWTSTFSHNELLRMGICWSIFAICFLLIEFRLLAEEVVMTSRQAQLLPNYLSPKMLEDEHIKALLDITRGRRTIAAVTFVLSVLAILFVSFSNIALIGIA